MANWQTDSMEFESEQAIRVSFSTEGELKMLEVSTAGEHR